MTHPPELSGGGGFTFGDAAVAIYLGALLGEESAPGLEDRTVIRVALEQAAYGEPLDDLIVDGRGADGNQARLSLQNKRELTVSDATTNTNFRQIVTNAWATVEGPKFRDSVDRVGAITGTISDASFRAFTTICEWARASNTLEVFTGHFQSGASDDDKRDALKAVQNILGDEQSATSAERAYRLLRHFVLIKIDVLHEGATHDTHAVERLRHHLADGSQAGALWQRLLRLARDAAGLAKEFSRLSLLGDLRGTFRLVGVHSLREDLERITEETSNALASITCEIDGVEIDRPALVSAVKRELEARRFVTIVGLPGTGKSAILHACVEDAMQAGTVLLLKSDRLTGPNWAAQARTLGLKAPTIDVLLSEIAATGSSVLYIDGIDRVETSQRGVIADLLNAIHRSKLLANWKIVATCRDNGIEPLRTWLPANIFGGGGVGTVEVPPFNDAEAEQLAIAKPFLRPLLFGSDQVKEIARRPFFAAVLAGSLRNAGLEGTAPQSEVELLSAWWNGGGYASGENRDQRQNALIKLAKAGAVDLGRRIPVEGIDSPTITTLRADGIIKNVRAGHTVQFAHDIFFEWAFLHLLINKEDAWLDEIKAVGEPPVLGRVVELLSQASLAHGDDWEKRLSAVEESGMRPQWTRAWLIAPFGAPTFWKNAGTFTAAVMRNKEHRLSKLAVWFQAEKTRANPYVLNRTFARENLGRLEIVRLADLLAWPSESASWSRFCLWSIQHVAEFPVVTIPDLLAAFEVWQNMFAGIKNVVSERIFATALGWLIDIEDRQHPERFSYNPGPWSDLRRGGMEELEKRLRTIIVRSAHDEPDAVRTYLMRVRGQDRLRRYAFAGLVAFSPTLVRNHSKELIEIAKLEILDDLPVEQNADEDRRGIYGRGFSYHDWHSLAIQDSYNIFYPPSPLREPFASLFKWKADEARTFVRDITNHAITAWQQLHVLDNERRATPIPLVFDFPWGRQTFWGDGRVYMWPRGHWAPNPVICALMALEKWAFDEVKRGRDADDVIRDVLEGHDSAAVLGIAAALAIEGNVVSATTLPLATSQKIWEWDIARWVQERGEDGIASNLLGFSAASDREHALAVRESNARPTRKMEIRWLAQLFVISSNEELRAKAQAKIAAFPSELAFDVEEERNATEHVANKRRTAEIWAEWGKLENYRATPAPDGAGTYIQLENPQSRAPDVIEVTENSARMNERLVLLQWASTSMDAGVASETLSTKSAIARARAIDRTDLFIEPHGQIVDALWDRNAVAAVAAAALLVGQNLSKEDFQWSKETAFRSARTPEFVDESFFAGSKHLHHPCLFAIRGMEGLIARNNDAQAAKEALLSLAAHIVEEVSDRALSTALSMWDRDSHFSWVALRLGISISLGSREAPPSAFGYSHATQLERMEKLAVVAITELRSRDMPVKLPVVPPAWIFAKRRRRHEFLEDDREIWREPDEFIRWDFLPHVMSHIPVHIALTDAAHATLLLDFVYQLVKWTTDKLEPAWMEEKDRRDHRGSELFEWRRAFGSLLAKVALEIDPAETQRKILDPIFALQDESANSLINPFVDILVASGIMDAPQISAKALQHIKACVDHVLTEEIWGSAHYRGEIYGHDLPEIIRVCLFATGIRAGQAAQFANGDWRDVTAILPVVHSFVRAVGDIPFVTDCFLTLCETAVADYPAEVFVDQVNAILDKQAGMPVGWYGTTVSSRIAALIHAFAERSQPLSAGLLRKRCFGFWIVWLTWAIVEARRWKRVRFSRMLD